jgi:hypothetical protein
LRNGCFPGLVDLVRPTSGREYTRALGQSNFCPPHPREVELSLRDLASALGAIASSVLPAILRASVW